MKQSSYIENLIGIDLCACCSGNQKKCEGICRTTHTNKKTNQVVCHECYRIDKRNINTEHKDSRRSYDYDDQKNDRPRRKRIRKNCKIDCV